ncbi:MAG TPA: hypothetical protein VJ650_12310 [Gemmatimonadaceae bacterium]|nr:hypothetical protein [Gemmatimonadaceae bacterium]
MLFTITHNGVPVGTVELTRADTSAAEQIACAVLPLPGYAPIQPVVRAASVALRNLLPAGPAADPGTQAAAERALGRGAELGRALELRDPTGLLVPTDFIELSEWQGGNPEVAALIRFRLSHAAVPARLPPRESGGTDAAAPAA